MPQAQDNLDSLTHSKIRDHNKIKFLPSGGESYEVRWKLLEASKQSIHIATFSMMKDETTAKLEEVLLRKLAQNIEVLIMLDEIVNRSTFAGAMLQRLEKAGAKIHRYNGLFEEWLPLPPSISPFKHIMRNIKLKLKRHYHEKYMIIDGVDVVLGGINWGDKYAFGGIKSYAWRDTDVYLQGPVVTDIQAQFLRDFTRYKTWDNRNSSQTGFYPDFVKDQTALTTKEIQEEFPQHFPSLPDEPAGDTAVRYVAHKPYDDNELTLTHAFLSLIENAEKSIYWGCHGIRPPKIYGKYLANAVKRGVKVHLITNSEQSAKSLMAKGLMGWMYKECTKYYRDLLNNGIHIYEWQLEGAFHSKNFLVDDKIVSIGSYNLARGSTYHHSESNIFVYNDDFAQQVKQQFDKDFESCKEIKLSKIESKLPKENAFDRPLHERDLMIQADMIPESIQKDLDKGKYKRILT